MNMFSILVVILHRNSGLTTNLAHGLSTRLAESAVLIGLRSVATLRVVSGRDTASSQDRGRWWADVHTTNSLVNLI